MNSRHIIDLGVSMTLIVASAIFIPKFQTLWMTSPYMPGILCGFSILIITFLALTWKEQAADEREDLHRAKASRFAFLITGITIALGIILQTVNGTLDPWLVIILITMIVGKLSARIYFEQTQ